MPDQWLASLPEPEEGLPEAADDETRDLELSADEKRELEYVETLEKYGFL